jgi:hypothetical protein
MQQKQAARCLFEAEGKEGNAKKEDRARNELCIARGKWEGEEGGINKRVGRRQIYNGYYSRLQYYKSTSMIVLYMYR